MWEFLVLLLVVGAIVLLVGPRLMRGRGPGGPAGAGRPGNSSGTLLVTGSSAGHESDGAQFVTITGVINGPTVREHEVYARMTMAVGTAPSVGQLMPVVYSTKNPDKWGFAPAPPPEAPQAPPSATELT